jgi:pyruvate dehydrogenase E2 component (dihydrolipoamide acetyltransferase)
VSVLGNRGEIRVQEPTAVERTIARRAAEGRATIPDLEFRRDVVIRDEQAVAASLVRACATALRTVPRANGAWRDGRFELYSRVNVGLVVETDEAHVIPTVFDADTKSIDDLAEEIEELSARARRGGLASPAFSGATFTLWNVAGVDSATIIPSQAAAVAAGAVRDAAVVRGGALAARRLMTLTLACDSRILYGGHAVRFLTTVAGVLEEGAA